MMDPQMWTLVLKSQSAIKMHFQTRVLLLYLPLWCALLNVQTLDTVKCDLGLDVAMVELNWDPHVKPSNVTTVTV